VLSTWWSNESVIKRHRGNLAPGAFGPPKNIDDVGTSSKTRRKYIHKEWKSPPKCPLTATIGCTNKPGGDTILPQNWIVPPLTPHVVFYLVSTCSNWNKETHPMTVKHAGDFLLPHCPGGTQLPKQPIIQSLCPITAGFITRRGFFWLLDFEQFNCN